MMNPSQRVAVNQPSIVVRGRVLSGDDLRDYAERNGLCPRCGVYHTHKKKGSLLKPRFEPMTVTNAYNEVTVYKGYCIAPTCYTLERAKQMLGEIPVKKPSTAATEALMSARPTASRPMYQPPPSSLSPAAPGGGDGRSRRIARSASEEALFRRNNFTAIGRTSDHSEGSGAHNRTRRLSGSDHRKYVPRNSNGDQHAEGGGSHHQRTYTADSSQYSAYQQRSGLAQDFSNNSGRNERSLVSPPNLNFHESAGSLNNEALPDTKLRAVSSAPLMALPLFSDEGDRTPSTITEHTEPSESDDPIVRSLEEKIKEHNYIDYFNLLDNKKREYHHVLEGFRLLRYYMVRDHMLRPEGTVLVGDNWVKVINEKIQTSQQRNERELVVSGLVTLLTISRQGMNFPYKRALVRKDTMDLTMKLFESCSEDEEIMDAACSLVVSLSLHEKNSLNAKSFPRIAILVRKLVNVVLSDDHCGKGLALRALFHISNQRKKAETTGKTALHDVRNALGNQPSIRAILEAISSEQDSPPIVAAGLSLLWKICLPKEEDNSKITGALIGNISSVVQILEQVNATCEIEAACGLLTNLALDQMFPTELAQRVAVRICDLMNNPENRTREVASVVNHSFCNLLANPYTKKGVVLVGTTVMNTILTLMEEYAGEEEIVEYGCLAVSHGAFQNPEMKNYLAGPEFFNRAMSAFDTFVASRGDQASLPVKDATLCFFACVSGCDVGANALTDSGLGARLQAMLARELDVDFKRILEVIARNTAKFMENNGSGGGLLRPQPYLFLQLLRNAASEEDVASVIQELRVVGAAGLPALGNHGFDELLTALTRHEYSPAVQTEGSNLLAEIYYRVPLDAVESPTQLPGGSWAVLHRKKVVDLLCSAIGGHPGDTQTQIASMMALENLLAPLCCADPSSPNVIQVQGWLEPVWKQAIGALATTPDNEKLQISGLHLCWILTIISSKKELRNWVLSLLQQVCDTMDRFTSDEDLTSVACDILLQLKENQDCTEFMGNSSCVGYMVGLLNSDNVEFVDRASAILSTLTTKVFMAVNQMMQVPNIIRQLISCMNSQQSQHHIVTNICVILEALLNFEDTKLRYSIVENGGVAALCSAIDAHQANATLCKDACRVISLLVPCLDASALGTLKASLESTLIPLIQVHVDNPESEAAVLDLLWALGSTDDYFKGVLQSEQNLQLIVQAMSCHLGSGDLQRSGCGMLWLLSGYGNGKRLIGQLGGIQAILNAMLAHNQSTSIQKEGLTALKNLATEATNKPLLAEHDCVQVVTYALWINYQQPLVISSALSALNNIAIDSRTKSVAPLPPAILDITLSAMRRFPMDEVLQSNACFYLKSCTYLPDNRGLMKQHTKEIFSVLQQASTNFPNSCQERAQSIMKKVQS
jgi:hypothetical protein